MTLHFFDTETSGRFIALCRQRGIHGSTRTTKSTPSFHVTAEVKDEKEKRALIAAWADRSMIRL